MNLLQLMLLLNNGIYVTFKGVFMKKVLFVLLCIAAIAVIPACKHMSCKKEEALPSIPQTELPISAPVTAPTPAQ